MHKNPPDRAYLDAFLQGARFSLFAMEGTLREKRDIDREAMQAVIDQLHEMFHTTRAGLLDRKTYVHVEGDPRTQN